MEEEPRVLEFTGEDSPVSHAYGTNGIITEIEIPLAPAYDWVEPVRRPSRTSTSALRFADLANQDGILIKLCTVFEAPSARTISSA
jgi:FAD/FMN-containing dehydrogenase